jgi:hypothetical protein
VATNKYFNLYNRSSEQNLIEDLYIEAVKIHGIDITYLPRTKQKHDLIFGEDVLSKFDDWYEIEIYIKNVDGFEGESEVFKKFGYDIKDQVTFNISKRRWNRVVGNEAIRPKEGDLIYFNMAESNVLFEIKFVQHEAIFYQLGQIYMYELICEKFTYSHEKIKTGFPEVDTIPESIATGYKMPLVYGAGSGEYSDGEYVYQGTSLATATASAKIIDPFTELNTLIVSEVKGAFVVGSPLIGNTSGASHILTEANTLDIKQDASAVNKAFQDKGDIIIDFSENNPFSEEDV